MQAAVISEVACGTALFYACSGQSFTHHPADVRRFDIVMIPLPLAAAKPQRSNPRLLRGP